MKMEDEVPVIDLAGTQDDAGLKSVGAQIAKACEEWGFFQIINHGVDLSLMDRIQEAYREFFYLPPEEKQKYLVDDQFQGWCCPEMSGHARVKKIGLITPETCEYMYHDVLYGDPDRQNLVPPNPPALRATVLEYATQVRALQERVLAALSQELGLEADALRRLFAPADVGIRANFYPLKTDDNTVGVLPAHSDAPVFTFLLADKVPGLEIRRHGRWMQVEPLQNAFIVNVADCLEVVSNGRFKSVEHKGGGNEGRERISIGAFYNPARAATIGPVAQLLDESSRRPRYGSARFADLQDQLVAKGVHGKRYVEALKIPVEGS
ncbi:protein MpDOXC12 [Marchantia polymorpha subsp. ruderalis]|uniref:Fe2OG dioxygenase domain-containing protein n=2 Tax=Marchantia polymorpha TaxID=3197 RepID=A0A176VDT0_MARPO|nr:hypothetical protein AXG93_4448s1280 [Marchantia polymorpha subsp. ruderalis]PTQ43442.1 hypothetical protein MARPO_0025s0124 [Marchantia polymorpha]BBN03690.1 hypothetical protein Mp_2g25540 [Marchantia polymorpha subsp. ruderalis]|eukprot:PTQ43442.1 hypothetical protein MARPO_0025s0124 [Marchantia polymorpha]